MGTGVGGGMTGGRESLFASPCRKCQNVPESGGVCEGCGSLWKRDEFGTLQQSGPDRTPLFAGLRPHLRYGSYVARHKWFVFVAGRKTGAPLWRLLVHDWSKMTRSEWSPYVRSFYGPWSYKDRPAEVVAAFDAAWLHHQHVNAHHWQHWVLREDSGATKVLEMPERLVREMVADWMGAGRAITGRWEVAYWYDANREKIILAPQTRALVEGLITG